MSASHLNVGNGNDKLSIIEPDKWEEDMPQGFDEVDDTWTDKGDESHGENVSNNDEDGLGDLPDVLPPRQASDKPWEPYITSRSFLFPPLPDEIERCLRTLENHIKPKRKTGYGYRDPHLNLVLCA